MWKRKIKLNLITIHTIKWLLIRSGIFDECTTKCRTHKENVIQPVSVLRLMRHTPSHILCWSWIVTIVWWSIGRINDFPSFPSVIYYNGGGGDETHHCTGQRIQSCSMTMNYPFMCEYNLHLADLSINKFKVC